MRISYVKGNILASEADVIVIPVNTVGVMGKGLALEYKNRYPQGFLSYKNQCASGALSTRAPGVYSNYRNGIPRWHIFFATKEHWRQASSMAYIMGGCLGLVEMLPKCASQKVGYSNNPLTVAIPKLGCGLGGLEWRPVHDVIIDSLKPLHDTNVEILIYGEKP